MQPILDVIRHIDPILLNSLTFLVGLVAGHRIALIRGKRQEFNAAIAPIRAQLIKDRDMARWWVKIPSAVELDSIEHLMLWPARSRLRRAIAAYRQCHEEQERCDEAGGRHYADPAAIQAAASRVLDSLTRR